MGRRVKADKKGRKDSRTSNYSNGARAIREFAEGRE